MIVFWLLIGLIAATFFISWLGVRSPLLADNQAKVRVALVIWFVAAGILHFTATKIEILMMPAFLPFKVALMYISGLAEIAGGVGLVIPRLQRAAGVGLIVLLLAVFPANINAAVNDITGPGLINDPWQQWARLPLQFVLMAIIAWATFTPASHATLAKHA